MQTGVRAAALHGASPVVAPGRSNKRFVQRSFLRRRRRCLGPHFNPPLRPRSTIYNMCTQKPPYDYSEQLYTRYREAFNSYISDKVRAPAACSAMRPLTPRMQRHAAPCAPHAAHAPGRRRRGACSHMHACAARSTHLAGR